MLNVNFNRFTVELSVCSLVLCYVQFYNATIEILSKVLPKVLQNTLLTVEYMNSFTLLSDSFLAAASMPFVMLASRSPVEFEHRQ